MSRSTPGEGWSPPVETTSNLGHPTTWRTCEPRRGRAPGLKKPRRYVPDGEWIAGDHELFTGKILPSPSGHPSSGHIKPAGRPKEGPAGQYYVFRPFEPAAHAAQVLLAGWGRRLAPQPGGESAPHPTHRSLEAQGGFYASVAGRTGGRTHTRRARYLGCPDPLPWRGRGRRGLVRRYAPISAPNGRWRAVRWRLSSTGRGGSVGRREGMARGSFGGRRRLASQKTQET